MNDILYPFWVSVLPLPVFMTLCISNLSLVKLSKKQLFSFGVLIFVTAAPGYFYGNFFALLMIASACLSIYFTDRSRPFQFCIVPISYLITAVTDNILMLVFISIFDTDYDGITKNPPIFLFFLFLMCLIILLISYLIGIIFKHIFHSDQKDTLPKEGFMIIAINLTLTCLIFLFNITTGKKIGYSAAILNFNTTLFLVYFLISTVTVILVLKSYEERMRIQQQVAYLENLQDYTSNLEKVYTNLRSFKHDYINIMTSMSAYLAEEKYEDLTEYFEKHILPLKYILNSNTENLNRLMNIKILEIKSLLSAKLMYAIELGIEVSIDIPDTIENIPMEPVDIVRILGIYLDNACEAAIESQHPILNFSMAKTDCAVVIIISNSFVDHGLNIADMKKSSVSTKGEQHGMGLYNVDQILNSYDNIFHETYIENSCFYQHMQIAL